MLTLAFYTSFEFSGHDVNLALVENNKVLYSYEEQKLSKTQQKEAKFFPDRAFVNCFNYTRVNPKSIDNFCLVGPNKLNKDLKNMYWSSEKYLGIKKPINNVCPHHKAHTYYSVLTSPFDECVFWTLDAGGADENVGEFGYFKNGKFKILHKIFKSSLPQFYYHITGACGFSDFEEGKVMGLSAYGTFRRSLYDKFIKLFTFDKVGNLNYNWEKDFSYPDFDWLNYDANYHRPYKIIKYLNRNTCNKLKKITLGYIPQDIAKTAQIFCENYAIICLRRMLKKYNLNPKNIVLGGGLFLNILINKRIREELKINTYIPPGVNDMTLAIGGGLWTNFKLTKNKKKFFTKKIFSPFLGPKFNNLEIKKEIDNFKLNFSKLNEKTIVKSAAKDLKNGKIIGWFQGRGEIGPRALGARSVLADPRNPESKARVNLLLKKRDWFMPYAPSILEEDAKKFVNNYFFSPYMTFAFDIKEDKRKLIPSAVHIDGTVRPNIVNKKLQKKYYLLIKEFKKITGISCILNTSFNKHGVPIVATPRDAIMHLLEGMIDVLYIENFKIIGNYRPKKITKIQLDEKVHNKNLIIKFIKILHKNKEFKNINLIKKKY